MPNINHFATQGSSGGPVGLINVNFIREVDFYSGAFPANRGNVLSSVMDFKQIAGNDEKLSGTFMVGSSDIGITLEGPAGKNSNFILSLFLLLFYSSWTRIGYARIILFRFLNCLLIILFSKI